MTTAGNGHWRNGHHARQAWQMGTSSCVDWSTGNRLGDKQGRLLTHVQQCSTNVRGEKLCPAGSARPRKKENCVLIEQMAGTIIFHLHGPHIRPQYCSVTIT